MRHTYTKVFGWFIWNSSLTGCPVLSLVISDGRRPFQASTSTVLGSALLPKLVVQANILLPNFPNLQRLSLLFSLFMGPSAQSLERLWKILKEMGIPDHLTCLLRNLYAGQEAAVRTGHGTTDCILSPCLFNLYVEYIIWNARLDESQVGVKIARRNISNLRHADDTTQRQKVKN